MCQTFGTTTSTRGAGRGGLSLREILERFRALYGKPKAPLSDPLAIILWENVAYLADDSRREEAFALLRETTGLSAARILAAPESTLREIARRGILSVDRATKLKEVAAIAIDEFGGDLDEVVRRPPRAAARALRRFPGIGAPGAEKILLFCRRVPALALDSNGLRVLLRLGYGREEKSYAASYRSAQAAAAAELPGDFATLISAHALLRRHGQELCRRTAPLCDRCPAARGCAYAKGLRSGG